MLLAREGFTPKKLPPGSCSQRWIHSPIINDSEHDARWVVRICPAIKTYITLFEFSVPFIVVDGSGKEKKALCT